MGAAPSPADSLALSVLAEREPRVKGGSKSFLLERERGETACLVGKTHTDLSVDPSGERRIGDGTVVGGRGSDLRVAGERGRRGAVCGHFAEKPSWFCEMANRSLAALKGGLRVLFVDLGRALLQKHHRRVPQAVGSTTDGRDRGTVVTVACYSIYCS